MVEGDFMSVCVTYIYVYQKLLYDADEKGTIIKL